MTAAGFEAGHSPFGIDSTAITTAPMFAKAARKARTGAAGAYRRDAGQPAADRGQVTLVDSVPAIAVLVGLILSTARA